MTVPSVAGTLQNVYYISENTFDTDNLIEYVATTQSLSTNGATLYRTFIINENGTVLFQRDSGLVGSTSNSGPFFMQDGIFYDGTAIKMKIIIFTNQAATIKKTEYYALPGSMPCIECSSTGTVTGITAPGNPGANTPVFYPNPVTDQLKLKYELPKDYKNAEIKIYDLQGKLIESMKVTDTFDFIYLPSDYNNGMYLYSLNVDGQTIKTEKVILNK